MDQSLKIINLDSKNDHICSWLPLYHDMGLFTTWLMPIIGRVPISMIDPFQWVKNPFSFLQLINDFQGTLCWLPNFAFNFLFHLRKRYALRTAKRWIRQGFQIRKLIGIKKN